MNVVHQYTKAWVNIWKSLPWADRRRFVQTLEKQARECQGEDRKIARAALESINHLRGMA